MGPTVCSNVTCVVCKKPLTEGWGCYRCELDGKSTVVCSGRCLRAHSQQHVTPKRKVPVVRRLALILALSGCLDGTPGPTAADYAACGSQAGYDACEAAAQRCMDPNITPATVVMECKRQQAVGVDPATGCMRSCQPCYQPGLPCDAGVD